MYNSGNLLNSTPNQSNEFSRRGASATKGIGGLVGRGHIRNNFAIFNDILQKSYQKIAFTPANNSANEALPPSSTISNNLSEIPGYQNVDKISSQQAAENILGFISQRIELDKANGAEQEELLQRLDQGLEGFIKGFNEAQDIIESMGFLTPALADEIGDTYNRVTSGIERLREGITGVDNNDAVSSLALAGNHSVSESFSLELTTQDGDRVTIDISRAQQSSYSAQLEQGSDSSYLNVRQQNSSSSSFNLSVNGELDEGELAAIDQLLQDVDAIAGDFFQGNLDQAFELALQLDINREELSSLNLQLHKTTTTRALAAYESTAHNDIGEEQTAATSPIIELNNLLDNIQDLLEGARAFAEPIALLDSLTNGVTDFYQPHEQQTHPNQLAGLIGSLASKFKL